jgi:hypothetical protein
MQIDHEAMGDKPLVVTGSKMVEEWRLFLDEGIRLGGGTEDEQREAEWWVGSAELFWRQSQRMQLGLSRNEEFIDFDEVGHAFLISIAEKTAEVVKKLLNRAAREDEVWKVVS